MGQPEKKFSSGLIKATVWKNISQAGEEFRSVSLNKSYKKNGEWKNSNSFGAGDIDKAIDVLQQAKEFLNPIKKEEVVA